MVRQIEQIKEDTDTEYGYIKMTYALKTLGYFVNKKKVYRLMRKHGILKSKHMMLTKNYAKYRKVLPEKPLEVLEMDIKFVWVEQYKRHALIITIIDTFTRHVLHYKVAYSIKKEQVKECWDHVIANHLQAYLQPGEPIHIEIRNDNDKRFSAKLIQDYFAENHINQVFTHPYTPQENGHVESFNSILSQHLAPYNFWTIQELEQNLILFYEKYNNTRIHSSIAYMSPRNFWELWNNNLIEKQTDYKLRKTKFKLKIPYDKINLHTGNTEPEVVPLYIVSHRNGAPILNLKEMVSAESSHNIRSKTLPSVVPCNANL